MAKATIQALAYYSMRCAIFKRITNHDLESTFTRSQQESHSVIN